MPSVDERKFPHLRDRVSFLRPPDAHGAYEILSHGHDLAEVVVPVYLAALQEGLEEHALGQQSVEERREAVEVEAPLPDRHGQRHGQAGVVIVIGKAVTLSLFDFFQHPGGLSLHEDIRFSHQLILRFVAPVRVGCRSVFIAVKDLRGKRLGTFIVKSMPACAEAP